MHFCCFAGTAEAEPTLEGQNQKSPYNPDHEGRGNLTTNDSKLTSTVKAGDEADKGKTADSSKKEAPTLEKTKTTSRNVAEQRQTELRAAKDASRPVDRSQIAATRTSLDHTITVSVT